MWKHVRGDLVWAIYAISRLTRTESISKVNICSFHYYISLWYFFHLIILFYFVEPSPADCEYGILSGMSRYMKMSKDWNWWIRLNQTRSRTHTHRCSRNTLKKIFSFRLTMSRCFFILYFSRIYRQHSASNTAIKINNGKREPNKTTVCVDERWNKRMKRIKNTHGEWERTRRKTQHVRTPKDVCYRFDDLYLFRFFGFVHLAANDAFSCGLNQLDHMQ